MSGPEQLCACDGTGFLFSHRIFTARKRSCGKVFTGVCDSVHGGWGEGGACPIACWDTPPARTHLPGQVHHPGRYTPRCTLPWQVHPPARTHPGQVHPPNRYTPGQVHPPGRYTPGQVHLPGRYTSYPHSACWDTVNKRAVRIPLECNLVQLLDQCSFGIGLHCPSTFGASRLVNYCTAISHKHAGAFRCYQSRDFHK